MFFLGRRMPVDGGIVAVILLFDCNDCNLKELSLCTPASSVQ